MPYQTAIGAIGWTMRRNSPNPRTGFLGLCSSLARKVLVFETPRRGCRSAGTRVVLWNATR